MTLAYAQELDRNIFTLFQRQAERRPDATAVIGTEGDTSYGVLMAQARGVADELVRRGLRPEQPVGVMMRRTGGLIATLLGILEAGGCYVPLDPDDPPERGRRIAAGAGLEIVLGDEGLLEDFGSYLRSHENGAGIPERVDVHPVLTSAKNTAGAGAKSERPQAPGGHRIAYILFTSGTTGVPKGVEVEHRGVVNCLLASRDLLGFTESDRWLATSTIGFDLSVCEIFLPLVTGGIVVLRDRRMLMEPRRLADEMRRHGVTAFQTGPSVWTVLLAEVPEFPRLRIAMSGGDALSPELARRLAGVADTAWNLYGPTEATVWVTAQILTSEAGPDRSSVSAPIGRPLPNVELRVVGEDGKPVAPGAEGELWIGGVQVARGYRDNESLTRERFVVDGGDHTRFYRTGDVAAQDADGTVHYFGRNDDQLKIRGMRIEPMEVESAILALPGVKHVAATWFPSSAGLRSLVAAIVAHPGARVAPEDLHRQLSASMPAAMVPSRFVFYDALPLSPSGKVDRKAIRSRALETQATSASESRDEAVSETEATLIRIWEKILRLPHVKRTDHFFTIGGDSLSAVTMLLEVESVYDVALTVRMVFEAPELDRLAAKIDRARSMRDDLGNSEFVFALSQHGSGRPVFFCSVDLRMARKGMWALDCPLYALVHWAMGSGFTDAGSVEELARRHIEGIRSTQPQGPYRLAGFSFGGLIALEAAQQLRAAGETVELLFLLDPSEPITANAKRSNIPRPRTPRPSEEFGDRMRRHTRTITSNPLAGVPYVGVRILNVARDVVGRIVRHRQSPWWEWLSYHLVHLYGRHPNPASARLLPRDRWPAFWYHLKRLGRRYVPRPYDGDVLAVFIDYDRAITQWRSLLPANAEIHQITAPHHVELFADPALTQWLGLLRARLDGTS